MKVMTCLELAAGKSVKIGDFLIIGVKKPTENCTINQSEQLLLSSDNKKVI
ncbi:hypothetical protein RRV45_15330 [Bacillus sp. DTU_2020_1000418_1_SI_GHA_SEK_038]|uniref:hypothetical protein n=1 Tax=Bacillus sp. DTU_2020_1000418_1_SI_GHA_SEK_038 TaxID=3077585 RepID=UPI0028E31554|nr:hypothetical protein [Bacillus sp. DTU_2020_1000418_1_SI_GHA_SEK_038]WNS74282.1 hypothetical protein RRV45_15330 [Bacillus sp. DTU_2020_1000418_1_SI_GHA_SEK_038]